MVGVQQEMLEGQWEGLEGPWARHVTEAFCWSICLPSLPSSFFLSLINPVSIY